MKTTYRATVFLTALLAISLAANCELIRVKSSISGAFMLWQSPHHIYGDSTYWGGIGIDLLYRAITLSGAMTVDAETFQLTERPAFSFGLGLTVLRLGPVDIGIGGGVMLQPQYEAIAVSAGPSVSWSPIPYTIIRAGLDYQSMLRSLVGPGNCISASIGVSVSYPLF